MKVKQTRTIRAKKRPEGVPNKWSYCGVAWDNNGGERPLIHYYCRHCRKWEEIGYREACRIAKGVALRSLPLIQGENKREEFRRYLDYHLSRPSVAPEERERHCGHCGAEHEPEHTLLSGLPEVAFHRKSTKDRLAFVTRSYLVNLHRVGIDTKRRWTHRYEAQRRQANSRPLPDEKLRTVALPFTSHSGFSLKVDESGRFRLYKFILPRGWGDDMKPMGKRQTAVYEVTGELHPSSVGSYLDRHCHIAGPLIPFDPSTRMLGGGHGEEYHSVQGHLSMILTSIPGIPGFTDMVQEMCAWCRERAQEQGWLSEIASELPDPATSPVACLAELLFYSRGKAVRDLKLYRTFRTSQIARLSDLTSRISQKRNRVGEPRDVLRIALSHRPTKSEVKAVLGIDPPEQINWAVVEYLGRTVKNLDERVALLKRHARRSRFLVLTGFGPMNNSEEGQDTFYAPGGNTDYADEEVLAAAYPDDQQRRATFPPDGLLRRRPKVVKGLLWHATTIIDHLVFQMQALEGTGNRCVEVMRRHHLEILQNFEADAVYNSCEWNRVVQRLRAYTDLLNDTSRMLMSPLPEEPADRRLIRIALMEDMVHRLERRPGIDREYEEYAPLRRTADLLTSPLTIRRIHDAVTEAYNTRFGGVNRSSLGTEVVTFTPIAYFAEQAGIHGSLRMELPDTSITLSEWGQRLHHCVGSYRNQVSSWNSVIYGVYDAQTDLILYCLEIKPACSRVKDGVPVADEEGISGVLIQAKGLQNSPVDPEHQQDLYDWLRAMRVEMRFHPSPDWARERAIRDKECERDAEKQVERGVEDRYLVSAARVLAAVRP